MLRSLCLACLGIVFALPTSAVLPTPAVWAEDLGTPDWMKAHLGSRMSNRRDNGQMMRLIAPLAQQAGYATVQVLSAGKPVALGTIVSTDGYVLTKHSELSADPIRVRLPDGRLMQARIAAVRRAVDLALLQVDKVRGLPRVQFATDEPQIGSFLISAGRGDAPIGLGVMGSQPRSVGHVGRLGVALRNDQQGLALVDGVWPSSGADEAGVLPGDRIVAINGKDEAGQKQVIQALRGMYPGEIVRLTLQRDDTTVEVEAQIRDFSLMQESENDARVNGERSQRLSGFERVIQHDTVLEPDQCGGPVLDTQGNVVGINIARAGRVVSYALPGSLVLPELVEMLKEARDTDDAALTTAN
ncbi:S1C family serine protease [Roseimaritima sediminicola]|uniref:S1C family serine protease n=1 Tax=Roseimaritima sediminicola TaxID=2662066 RepID=UPI0012983CE1|nr:S1C family serine protease [Roseimaritima sediminicola]